MTSLQKELQKSYFSLILTIIPPRLLLHGSSAKIPLDGAVELLDGGELIIRLTRALLMIPFLPELEGPYLPIPNPLHNPLIIALDNLTDLLLELIAPVVLHAHHAGQLVFGVAVVVVGQLHGELLLAALQVRHCGALHLLGFHDFGGLLPGSLFERLFVDAAHHRGPQHQRGHSGFEELLAAVLHAVQKLHGPHIMA